MQAGVVKRTRLLRVPIDILEKKDIKQAVEHMLKQPKPSQIVLFRWSTLIRTWWSRSLRSILHNADLVLPVSASIVASVRFFGRPTPHRFQPFDFLLQLLSALEQTGGSIYFLGMSMNEVQNVGHNIVETYPSVRIVGSHSGFFNDKMELNVITAIRKAAPQLLFVGPPLSNRWVHRNKHRLHPCIVLWSGEAMNILRNRQKRISKRDVRYRARNNPAFFPAHPWRILQIPLFVLYLFVLIVARIFRLG